jgi:FMN phosphatase YigB (HAD superfamily)
LEPELFFFDVFETLVSRETAHPEGVYGEIGLAIARRDGAIPAPLITESRLLAERLAYQVHGPRTTLRDIATQLSWLLTGTADQAEAYAASEEEVERRLLRPVPDNVSLVESIRARSGRIAYLSDTWHRSAFLGEVLVNLEIRVSGEPVLTSCELGVTKASGRAYRRAARTLGVRPSRIRHHGDNAEADIRMARLAGIQAQHLDLLQRTPGPAAAPEVPRSSDSEIEAMTALLWNFSGWTLLDAVERDIEQLCFVGRDGYVPLRIARRLIRLWDIPIRVGYLPFSKPAAAEIVTSPDARAAAAAFIGRRVGRARYGLVDLGWLGNAASNLLGSLAALQLPAPAAFYHVGHYGELLMDSPLVSFVNEPRARTGIRLHTGSIRLLEAVTTAPTGTVVTFSGLGQEAKPVFASSPPADEARRIRLLQKRLLAGSAVLPDPSSSRRADLVRLRLAGIEAAAALDSCLMQPSRESASLWTRLPVDHNHRRTTLGRGYNASDLARKAAGRANPEPRIWVEGSWLVSPFWVRAPRTAVRAMLAATRRSAAMRAVWLRVEPGRTSARARRRSPRLDRIRHTPPGLIAQELLLRLRTRSK